MPNSRTGEDYLDKDSKKSKNRKAYSSENPFEENPCKKIDCGRPPKIYPHEKKRRKIIPVYSALNKMKKRGSKPA